MSCSINLSASITDISAIRRCLFPTDDTRGGDGWLQSCSISVSPTGDLIALAHERRLVILASKWDNTSINYNITFSGSIHDIDNIKAVALLPIVSQSKSSHIVPDWTCILLGFESGYLRFYTESCELLVEEQLHNEVISGIKCRSQHNPRPDISPELHPDEIYVQYQSTVCVVPGNQIFPMLRICRADLARVQAKGETLEPLQGNLAPKKWGFTDQATINDIAVVGVNLHGQFDHLLTASTYGGFETKYRSAAPYNNLVLAAGTRPFLGYHYALEGMSQPVFSDVAKAVATKLKSALPGWLTGSKSTAAEKQLNTSAMQPSDTMGCRFGLCDLRRAATALILSPDHKLAAVSDALGRVLLVDAYRGIVLRVFKGYRDAQCAFIQVPDERHSKHRIGNKVALFLVIYSPKKGTIEIFAMQQGRKICTFTASKHSRLVYNNYGLMGFMTTSKSRFVCQFDTVLIDNDGLVKEISVPFHFALSEEKNNKKARDVHLVKKIRQMLKTGSGSEVVESISNLLGDISLAEYKAQIIEMLLSTEDFSEIELLLNKCITSFVEPNSENNSELDVLIDNVKCLLNFFTYCREKHLDNGETKDLFKIEGKQLKTLKKLLDLTCFEQAKPAEVRVGFQEPKTYLFTHFAKCFNLKQSNKIEINPNLDAKILFKCAQLIFEQFLHIHTIEEFVENVKLSKIPLRDSFFLLLHYWVHKPLLVSIEIENEMNQLYNLMSKLLSLADNTEDELKCEYSESSPFFEYTRELLLNSSRPFPALTAAIVCKRLCQQINELESEGEEDIEVLSQETIDWSLLIGKLEDISLLNIILSNKAQAKDAPLPKLKQEKCDISLKHILENGKGSVSELVAKWLSCSGLNPENVIINEKLLKKMQDFSDNENSNSDSENENDDALQDQPLPAQQIEIVMSEEVLQRINLLKKMFPYSLESSNLLANMCWEYCLTWQKDISNLENLRAAINCLKFIPNCFIREGISKLVWNTHLKVIFEASAKLLNKVGKLPKERLCKQDTGLADYQIVILLDIISAFFDQFQDAVNETYGKVKPNLHFEQIWESCGQNNNVKKPLVELAINQNHSINNDLLHLHYQLSVVLQIMSHFTIKQTKPMATLFESYMLGLFFQDFTQQQKSQVQQINWNYADFKVQENREQFLKKSIAASLESVTIVDNMHYAKEHNEWIARIMTLARLWNLDLDKLRRYQVVQIYASGMDAYGDELFSTVENKSELGVELLAVAGRRLAHFFATSENLAQNTCAFTPAVTRYIEQLEREWSAPSNLESIENLANRSLSCLNNNNENNNNQSELKIAEYMLDGIRTLINVYENDKENDEVEP